MKKTYIIAELEHRVLINKFCAILLLCYQDYGTYMTFAYIENIKNTVKRDLLIHKRRKNSVAVPRMSIAHSDGSA